MDYDAYVVGELRHEAAVVAKDLGLTLVGVSHYALEVVGMKRFAEVFRKKLVERGYGVEVLFIDVGCPIEGFSKQRSSNT